MGGAWSAVNAGDFFLARDSDAVQELRDATCPGCVSYRNAGGVILSQNKDFISEIRNMLAHVLDIRHTCTGFFFFEGSLLLKFVWKSKDKNAGTMSRLAFRKWTFAVAFCWSIWLNTQNVLMYLNKLLCIYVESFFFLFSSPLFFSLHFVRFVLSL